MFSLEKRGNRNTCSRNPTARRPASKTSLLSLSIPKVVLQEQLELTRQDTKDNLIDSRGRLL